MKIAEFVRKTDCKMEQKTCFLNEKAMETFPDEIREVLGSCF